MAHIIQVLGSASSFVGSEHAVILTVLGVAFAIAKMFSTEKATGIVSAAQGFFDGLAHLCSALGSLAQELANLLASVVKSDGVLGNK